MTHTAFYDTIYNLRTNGEIILYEKLLNFKPDDEKLVADFLQIEYESEAEGFPGVPPLFDAKAALWAARTTYTICQLVLYRQDKASELPLFLPIYQGNIEAGSILSADLCLRFLPEVLTYTKHVDPEDSLIASATTHLLQWHYSGIGYPLEIEHLDFEKVISNACLYQLYADRVIEKKDKTRSNHLAIKEKVKASMGNYSNQFWKEFNY